MGEDPQLDLATITNILTYHVVVGMWPSTLITDGLELQTVQGQTIEFSVGEEGVFIEVGDRLVPIEMDVPRNPAKPITLLCVSTMPPTLCGASDQLAINGILHKLGGVLIPQ